MTPSPAVSPHGRPVLIAKDKPSLQKHVRAELQALGQHADLNHIDVSRVTDLSCLGWLENFQGDISRWDVSRATSMQGLFSRSKFNGDISNWNVANVTDMNYMFNHGHFNGDLSRWDTSKVKSMVGMFEGNRVFNGDVSKWNVQSVQDMSSVFACTIFQGDVSDWNTRNVRTMFRMFEDNRVFNSDLSKWNVSSVESFDRMFEGTQRFNSRLSNWDVSGANNFNCMFSCSGFGGSIADWPIADGAKLTDMFDNLALKNRRDIGLYHWWVAQDHPEYLSGRQREHFDKHAPTLMGLGLSQVETARTLLDMWRRPAHAATPGAILALPELF